MCATCHLEKCARLAGEEKSRGSLIPLHDCVSRKQAHFLFASSATTEPCAALGSGWCVFHMFAVEFPCAIAVHKHVAAVGLLYGWIDLNFMKPVFISVDLEATAADLVKLDCFHPASALREMANN